MNQLEQNISQKKKRRKFNEIIKKLTENKTKRKEKIVFMPVRVIRVIH